MTLRPHSRLLALAACLAFALTASAQPSPGKPLADKIRRQVQQNLRNSGIPAGDVDDDLDPPKAAAPPLNTPAKPLAPHLTKPTHPSDPLLPNPHAILAPGFGDRLDISPAWLFHQELEPYTPGSPQDPASPAFDDSQWPVIDTSRPLFTNMIFNPNEIWYRAHIRLAPGAHDLALSLVNIGGSYRLLVNGRELGGHGTMSGRGDYLTAPSDTFIIPNDLLVPAPGAPPGTPPEITVALHLFAGTVNNISFGLQTGISAKSMLLLGPTAILLRDQRYYAQTSSAETGATLTVWAVVLILAIALTILLPQVRVYPVLAVYAAAHLLARILANVTESNYLSHTHWITWPQNLALVITIISALELCRLIAGSPRRLWLTFLEFLYTLSIFAIYPATWGYLSFYLYGAFFQAARFALVPAFLFFVIAGALRKRIDAIILLSTAAAFGLYALAWLLLSKRSLTNILADTFVRGFASRFTPAALLELAFILGFLVVLIVHTLRIIRERTAIATEMQAARTMQQLLLARSSDPTPGFIVETAYLPAGDVGGDFFLAGLAKPQSHLLGTQEDQPTQDLFAIVGDVSGKGLKAAMNVSMILGVLRREPSRDPATVLCSLNEALLSQADTGFTTACCIRLTPAGHYTIANAGHLAPYLVGPRRGILHAEELITPPTLPLGLAPDQQYEVIAGRLAPGQRLVLLSDGIPKPAPPAASSTGLTAPSPSSSAPPPKSPPPPSPSARKTTSPSSPSPAPPSPPTPRPHPACPHPAPPHPLPPSNPPPDYPRRTHPTKRKPPL